MARIRYADTPTWLSHHTQFDAGNLRAENFFRLSPPPMSLQGVDSDDQLALIQAALRNHKHYLPECAECGETITWDHGDLRVWVHVQEFVADHVAMLAEKPDSHVPPPDGLAYLVRSYGMPIVWVLNDGTIVQTTTRLSTKQMKHVDHVLTHLTPNHVNAG